jgi:hypothetical protein
MTHAIVLIQADRSAIKSLGGALADVEGVAEAYSVTGEWDYVAKLIKIGSRDVCRRKVNLLECVDRRQQLFALDEFRGQWISIGLAIQLVQRVAHDLAEPLCAKITELSISGYDTCGMDGRQLRVAHILLKHFVL